MPTKQQIEELQTVLCGCEDRDLHTLGQDGCTATVKPGTYGSWKPAYRGYGQEPDYPIADIYAELARHATDKATKARYRFQAATERYANKYSKP